MVVWTLEHMAICVIKDNLEGLKSHVRAFMTALAAYLQQPFADSFNLAPSDSERI